MSLPVAWVEKIFDRLELCYGDAFMRQYSSLPPQRLNDMKSVWCAELGAYVNAPECIAYALANLPERPPNVFEFRNLCRVAPRKTPEALPAPKADPARVAAELEKMRGLVASKEGQPRPDFDTKQWAKDLLKRAAHPGHGLTETEVRMAKAALGLDQQHSQEETIE